jgi:hypothetical protein
MGVETRVPDLALERYRSGDLPAAQADDLRAALAADPALRARLAALEASDGEILAAVPPAAFAAGVARRLREAPDRPLPWRARLVPTAAIVAAVVAANVLLLQPPPAAPVPFGDRAKGGSPALLLFRKAAAAAERLDSGALARADDVVQVVYQSGGHRYGVIVSIDGRGVVTRHLPSVGDVAAALAPDGVTPLAAAYRLDDAPRVERFFLVAADTPFDVPTVVEAARAPRFDPATAERLPLDPPFVQASFLLRKE